MASVPPRPPAPSAPARRESVDPVGERLLIALVIVAADVAHLLGRYGLASRLEHRAWELLDRRDHA